MNIYTAKHGGCYVESIAKLLGVNAHQYKNKAHKIFGGTRHEYVIPECKVTQYRYCRPHLCHYLLSFKKANEPYDIFADPTITDDPLLSLQFLYTATLCDGSFIMYESGDVKNWCIIDRFLESIEPFITLLTKYNIITTRSDYGINEQYNPVTNRVCAYKLYLNKAASVAIMKWCDTLLTTLSRSLPHKLMSQVKWHYFDAGIISLRPYLRNVSFAALNEFYVGIGDVELSLPADKSMEENLEIIQDAVCNVFNYLIDLDPDADESHKLYLSVADDGGDMTGVERESYDKWFYLWDIEDQDEDDGAFDDSIDERDNEFDLDGIRSDDDDLIAIKSGAVKCIEKEILIEDLFDFDAAESVDDDDDDDMSSNYYRNHNHNNNNTPNDIDELIINQQNDYHSDNNHNHNNNNNIVWDNNDEEDEEEGIQINNFITFDNVNNENGLNLNPDDDNNNMDDDLSQNIESNDDGDVDDNGSNIDNMMMEEDEVSVDQDGDDDDLDNDIVINYVPQNNHNNNNVYRRYHWFGSCDINVTFGPQ